jgi:hypothetical protein
MALVGLALALTPALGLTTGFLFIAGVGLIALGAGADPGQPRVGISRLDLVAAVGVATVGAFFLLSHYYEAPGSYNCENINYLEFAIKLRHDRFPYIPFSWYSHTLLSYLVAIASLLTGVTTDAIRLASAADGAAAILFGFLFLRRIFGLPTAITGAVLLAVMPLQQFDYRVGFHHQFVVTAQLATGFALFSILQQPTKWFYPWLAGLAVIAGFHAHYAGYGLVGVWFLFLGYLAGGHPARFRAARRPLLVASALIAIGLTVQLAVAARPAYIYFTDVLFHGVERGTGMVTWYRKAQSHLLILADMLLGMNREQSHGYVLSWLVSWGFLVGAGRAFRSARSSPEAFFLALLWGVYFTSQVFLDVSNQYVGVLIPSIVALAAEGIWFCLYLLGRFLPEPAFCVSAAALLAVLLGLEGYGSYQRFFSSEWLGQMWLLPGTTGHVFERRLRDDLQKYDVYFARFPDQDLFNELDRLSRFSPEYLFVQKVHQLYFGSPILGERGDSRPVRVYLRTGTAVTRIWETAIQAIYPHAQTGKYYFPATGTDIPIADCIDVPIADLESVRGPRRSADGRSYHGLLTLRVDRRVRIGSSGGALAGVRIGGASVSPETGGRQLASAGPGFATTLLRGSYPIDLSCTQDDCLRSLWIDAGNGREPLEAFLSHLPETVEARLAPMLAFPTVVADAELVHNQRLWAKQKLSAATLTGTGQVVAATASALLWFGTDGQPQRQDTGQLRPSYLFPEGTSEVIGVGADGDYFAARPGSLRVRLRGQCPPVQASYAEGRVTLVCRDGRVLVSATSGWQPLKLGPHSGPWRSEDLLFGVPGGWLVVERDNRLIVRYDETAQATYRHHVSGFPADWVAWADSRGNLYLPEFGAGARILSAAGAIELSPRTLLPYPMLWDATKSDLVGEMPSRLSVNGPGAVMVQGDTVAVFHWEMPVPTH